MIMPLIYFILGILFISYIYPILMQLMDWLYMAIEHKRMLLKIKNVKLEKRIEEIIDTNNVKTRQIGFIVENPEEYQINEEDFDE